jgi:hypothetical protein
MEFVEGHLFWPHWERDLSVAFSRALDCDKTQTARLAIDVCIDRDTHYELIGGVTLLHRVLQDGLASASVLEVVMEIVMGNFPAVHPFIEEPIHAFAEVFFHHLAKILCGGILGRVGRCEILHHLNETLVRLLEPGVFHKSSQHFQYVGALVIDQDKVEVPFQISREL